MKRALVLVLVLSAGYAHANLQDRVKGRTVKCGSKTLVFSADGWDVKVNGNSTRAQWGNGLIDADIDGEQLELLSGSSKFELEGRPCRL